MEQEVIILSADFWSIPDEKTKEIKEGTTVWYIGATDIAPKKNSERSYGYAPVKATVDGEFIHAVAAVGGCPCKAVANCVIKTQNSKQVIVADSFVIPKK